MKLQNGPLYFEGQCCEVFSWFVLRKPSKTKYNQSQHKIGKSKKCFSVTPSLHKHEVPTFKYFGVLMKVFATTKCQIYLILTTHILTFVWTFKPPCGSRPCLNLRDVCPTMHQAYRAGWVCYDNITGTTALESAEYQSG